MNKRSIVIIQVLLLVLAYLPAAGCLTQGNTGESAGNRSLSSVDKVEVYHFHATRQCYSCVVLGEYAEETVKTYFGPELASGKLVFGHINVDLPENRAIVERYGPTGSSLWIGVTNRGEFSKEENIRVWYKIGNKEEYMEYLKGVIEKRLAGDLS
ncbi:MAG: nitrophenyl compound nitroreductase subunit ArsF family protein [Methanolinea sp.]|nr:nitrophenyl compound nitroreductase subunit ArsF family protein [Methanolinea sp.]